MCPTGSRSLRALFAASILVAAGSLLSGCLKAEGHLNRDGGGTLKLEISKLDAAGDLRVRAQLVSPAVKLTSAAYADGVGTYEVAFTDARKLRTAPLFRHLRIQHSGLGEARRTISVSIPRRERTEEEKNLPGDNYVVIDLKVHVPGTVVETNGTRAGDAAATWEIRVEDMLGTGFIGARSVYEVAAAP
jgi:hypothetical protein